MKKLLCLLAFVPAFCLASVQSEVEKLASEYSVFDSIDIEYFDDPAVEIAYGYIYPENDSTIYINTYIPDYAIGHVLFHELCGLYWHNVLTAQDRIDWYGLYLKGNFISPYSKAKAHNYFEEWCVYIVYPEIEFLQKYDKDFSNSLEERWWDEYVDRHD